MAETYFVQDPLLTAIAVGYKNEAYIADLIAPVKPVGSRDFAWVEYPLEGDYEVLDTEVGRLSQPKTLGVSGTRRAATTQDYGLDGPIPNEDLAQDAGQNDIKGKMVEKIANALLLDREKRVARLVQTAANYPGRLTLTLSGADKISDPSSNPQALFLTCLDKPLMRPNVLVLGHEVWSKLRQHPRLVKAVKNISGEGAISAQELAELLEVERVIVGKSRVNIARPGWQMQLERVWGDTIALLYIDPSADFQTGGVTFALTTQWGGRIAGEIEDVSKGLRGAIVVRAGFAQRELVIAPHAGFLIQGAI